MPHKDLETRREYAREYQRAWAKKNPEKKRAYEKTARLRHPEKWRAKARRQAVRRKYGIEQSDYDRMFEEQGGVCKICKRPQRARRAAKGADQRRLCIDHDHATGKVRGLLCDWCNTGLGFLESPMRAAFEDYLERYSR